MRDVSKTYKIQPWRSIAHAPNLFDTTRNIRTQIIIYLTCLLELLNVIKDRYKFH